MREFVRMWILRKLKYKNCDIDSSALIDTESEIGEYVYVGKNTKITKASIGRYTSIGDNVQIGPGEHNIHDISTSSYVYEQHWREYLTKKKCVIGNDVWIGTGAVIKRGVTVGDGAVIGANAVVCHDVEEFAVVVGVPAKCIKYRFEPQKQVIIKKTSWWNCECKEAIQIINKIRSEINNEV